MKKFTKEEQNREQNRKYKTLIKNDFKKFNLELKNSSKDNVSNLKDLLSAAQKNIDKSVSKKIIHKNNAARKTSRLFELFNSLNKQNQEEKS
ncbi:MAG: 30S ribosomal protein S20 [Mycoplasmataceae bacterium]|nr:MAG: 30S ribosomal protein S20 [Mycoplasmataceae bacterium]